MMTTEHKELHEIFSEAVSGRNASYVDPCFMTGMGCSNTHHIQKSRERRAKRDKKRDGKYSIRGFMIMPFQPKLNVFFKNTLKPFFEKTFSDNSEFEVSLVRADEAQRTGTIICEGICRKIQEANFVVADISVPNENVFYEIGLAYGMGKCVFLVNHCRSSFGKDVAEYIQKGVYNYSDLSPIEIGEDPSKHFVISAFLWQNDASKYKHFERKANICLVELLAENGLGGDSLAKMKVQDPTKELVYNSEGKDIDLGFTTHVKSDVGIALATISDDSEINKLIQNRVSKLEEMKQQENILIDHKKPYEEFKRKIDHSYCLIVRTGRDCHPMAYFWLGYGHSLGKNTLPITQMAIINNQTKEEAIQDLAFDIRAQRHMTFSHFTPEKLESQIRKVLREIVVKDFTIWSRKNFWDRIVGSRGEVSLITGALHVDYPVREMVGDWDLRTASELASYFNNQQYRPRIETPIYQIDSLRDMSTENYISHVVADMGLADKNCVIIASPDVNPLTEIMFGRLYGVNDKQLFRKTDDNDSFIQKHRNAVITKKAIQSEKGKAAGEASGAIERAFYLSSQGQSGGEPNESRGLCGWWIKGVDAESKPDVMLPYLSQQCPEDNQSDFSIYAHLLIAKNPFACKPQTTKYVIVLNGVSGPATYALAHVLTGGVNWDFTLYNKEASNDFNPHVHSEDILGKILTKWAEFEKKEHNGLQCIIKIMIDKKEKTHSPIFDWRHIKRWDQVGDIDIF